MKTPAEKSAFAGGVCLALSHLSYLEKTPTTAYLEIVMSVGPAWLLRWATANGDPEAPMIRKAYRLILARRRAA